jgi:hypothetical protein
LSSIYSIKIDEIEKGQFVSNIYSLILLERLDKRPDRVEISPEQLSNATEHSEVFVLFMLSSNNNACLESFLFRNCQMK